MPIDADLLERIKKNDLTLKVLFLSSQNLNDNDIQQLVTALETNTVLNTLDVSNNQIGDEGAKALAANTTLITLNIQCNQIGDEGVRALAANTTLTTLQFRANQPISEEAHEQLEQAIVRNNQQLISRRRNQFIRTLILLAYDKANSASQSLWSRLPQELMVYIISLIDFRAGSIGKNAQQIKRCVAFMFTHVADLKGALREAIKTQQDFKIMEKCVQGKSQFQFFPPPPLVITEEGHGKTPTQLEKHCTIA